MQKIIIGLIVVMLAGCNYDATYDNVVYVGDSNCALFNELQSSAAMHAGIVEDCVIGRKLLEVSELPDVDLVFLALGANDTVEAKVYGDHLDTLIGSTAAVVVCVKPVGDRWARYDDYRAEIDDHCIEKIDPLDAPVTVAPDGYHYTDDDSQYMLHFLLVDKMNEILE